MAIIYHPNKKIFTLHTAHTTYQMQIFLSGLELMTVLRFSVPRRSCKLWHSP